MPEAGFGPDCDGETALDVLRERAEIAEKDWLFVKPPLLAEGECVAEERGWSSEGRRSGVLSDARDRPCASSGKVRLKSARQRDAGLA